MMISVIFLVSLMLLIMTKHWESWIAFNWGRGGQFILLGQHSASLINCNVMGCLILILKILVKIWQLTQLQT